MIEIYFLLFFAAGLAWGVALAPFNPPTINNYFTRQSKDDSKIQSVVREAKANLKPFTEKGNA